MEKIALSLVEPIVSPIVGKLKNAALSYFGGDITEKELQQLQTTILPKIKAVLLAAEANNVEVLQPYLVKLKEAAYEAEDVLDMFEYQCLEDQVLPLWGTAIQSGEPLFLDAFAYTGLPEDRVAAKLTCFPESFVYIWLPEDRVAAQLTCFIGTSVYTQMPSSIERKVRKRPFSSRDRVHMVVE
ncbi:putative disease resistance protein RGA2 isoform X4 [Iris pallida]|uniref:Disease resistance protein RGA2 isoform X4 n=1 Tax=Iris pallida TaxID=29817 RepID=A0AAX6HDB6_IRIPA|nr:putative disease resistance protein RGA2 isoform X4 [Iris pallida]